MKNNILETEQSFIENKIEQNFEISSSRFRYALEKETGTENKKRIIKGYASTSNLDRQEDIITHEALMKAKDDLLQQGSRTVFFNHDRNIPIGKTIATSVDQKGLFIEVMISKATDVNDVWTKIKEGILNAFSIGGRFKKVRVERDEEGRISSFQVLEIELFEVSVVGIPANPAASITEVFEKCFSKEKEMKKTDKVEDKKEEKVDEKVEDKKTETTEKKEEKVEVTVEVVQEMISKSVSGLEKSISTLADAVKAMVVKEEKTDKVEDKKEDKTEEVPAWAKNLATSVENMQKELNKVSSRKGIVDEEADQDQDEEENSDIPQKSLVGPEDKDFEKSVEYVKYIMNEDTGEYDKLSDSEKKVADAIYMGIFMNKQLKSSKR